MPPPRCEPFGNHVTGGHKVQELHRPCRVAQAVAVGPPQGRAGHHARALSQNRPHRLQPRPAVGIGQGLARRHLGAVGRRVQIIGVRKWQRQCCGQRGPKA